MPKKYCYDYPDQREFAKDLVSGDTALLARWTGYAPTTINHYCTGRRKMPAKVKVLIEKIYNMRSEIENFAEKQNNNAG